MGRSAGVLPKKGGAVRRSLPTWQKKSDELFKKT
jgi:hypothetical protein